MINTVEKKYDATFTSHWSYLITWSDGTVTSVPNDTENRHYQEIQEWAAIEGNNIIDPGA
tara:strand:+ start:429 stop:608 length:180 start_codon:yes stop_codon:yes gene_type:complete